jgi:hypothetical protein
MNEQLLELAKQAGLKKDHGSDREYIGDFDWREFAELIVRECAELIDNKVTITAAQTYDEVFVAKYDTKELCANQIREHFGLKE